MVPIVGIFAALLTATAALLAVRRRYVVVEVDGISMTPTYRPGSRVLVRRCGVDRVQRGQVVVFEPPDRAIGRSPESSPLGALAGRRWYIKRTAAIAGDPVPPGMLEALDGQPATVPEGTLVVIGDNPRSDDSRRWGCLPGERVLGVVLRQLGSDPERPVDESAAVSPRNR